MLRLTGRIATSMLAGVIALPVVNAWRTHRRPVVEPDRSSVAWKTREDALSRARVFVQPAPDHPVAAGLNPAFVECRYSPKPTKATSPKFDCELPNGDVIKVKYGTLEIQAEVAATRLMAALGFAADRVMLVERLRCHGCPTDPFRTRRAFEYFSLGFVADWLNSAATTRDFEWVAVERRYPGRAFEIGSFTGWHVNELDRVDSRRGGATRAEVDALRLMVLLLGHWDNKLDNQRLICREDPDGDESDRPCRDPLLMIHDLGATFGYRRVDLASWRAQTIWAGDEGCRGSKFVPAEISETGRQFTVRKLNQITADQLAALFREARFPDPVTGETPGSDMSPWVETFQSKVREISQRPPCPATTRRPVAASRPRRRPGRWRRLTERAARGQSEILLSLLYFVMLVPLGLVRRLFANPFDRRPPAWIAAPKQSADLDDIRRQF